MIGFSECIKSKNTTPTYLEKFAKLEKYDKMSILTKRRQMSIYINLPPLLLWSYLIVCFLLVCMLQYLLPIDELAILIVNQLLYYRFLKAAKDWKLNHSIFSNLGAIYQISTQIKANVIYLVETRYKNLKPWSSSRLNTVVSYTKTYVCPQETIVDNSFSIAALLRVFRHLCTVHGKPPTH